MKYTMVKQFSNAVIDNMFGFVFKIVDFGKIMVEVFWAFVDIWEAFFLIFYNAFMYVYYLFLFMIDRGSESSGPAPYRARRAASKRSKIPSVSIDRSPTPIPSMYRVKAAASAAADTGKAVTSSVQAVAEKTADTVEQIMTPLKPKGGSKKPVLKTLLEFLTDVFKTVKDFIIKPFAVIADFLAGKLMPVKESEARFNEAVQKRSLIDEYMKEYEKKQKKRK
ncbi:MAG TPA: hypothetical protein PK358_15110 [Spirochaetota bacterium]|nr:hypothetical protein [Spirochaetota bacterium]HPJ36168.1 hypothetical protein [Spirochaetota bacterium]